MDTNKRQRVNEINAELKQLSQRRRELLEERHRLSEGHVRISQLWVDPIYAIIENHPGVSRHEIVVALDSRDITVQEFTNCLTTLRRRGWIENHGTRKNPRWYARERTPRSRWNTRESIPS